MGPRGRSIRLRIYVLVAIPLITMLGLFGYVAYTSVTNWQNLERAPSLIQATSEPLTNFVNVLQAERRAAVVYVSQPNAANLASYQQAIIATKTGGQQLAVALNSPGTKNSATPAETAAISTMTAQINSLSALRASVAAKKLTPLNALAAYTNIIAGQGAVLQTAATSITDAGTLLQGLGLISAVNTQEDMSEQDAALASALASGSLTGPDRVAFSQAAGRQQDDTLTYKQLLTPAELAIYTGTINRLAPTAVQNNLTTIQEAVPAGIPLSEMEAQGLNPTTWQSLTGTWLKASSVAGTTSANAGLEASQQPAIDAKRRVVILAAVGAAGLILTLLVSLLLSRSINRRLTTLRRSALTLAQEQLPSVVARLRRGESVDVAAEAPPLVVGGDEIGQVGQAIDAVRQTAIRSAIDEARVRQGVNDMFRNLARRNQSLLQRQLTVLDEMERRAIDPDVLEDLFKMDHLTTRMRRHAEGLIILSGAPPGRSWSAPVKLVDVMRGAVAEVEDYARVTVSTQAPAALAGSAVTDLIHLLAELIENATSLSPPFTQVRVGGETVANGFAIEIEDRGLGMVPQRLQELNERLANPPDLNPANTEQLGLFVVGQLAKRHGVRVMLRPSPYGGTTAVVLIPLVLIVEDGPAAITSGGRGPAAAGAGPGAGPGAAATGAYGANRAYGNGAYGSNGNGGSAAGAGTGGAWPGTGRASGNGTAGRPAAASYNNDGPLPSRAGYQPPDTPGPRDPAAGSGGIRISGALRHPQNTGGFRTGGYSAGSGYGSGSGTGAAPSAAESGTRRGRHGTDDVPVVTGVPVGRSATAPPPEFDVFTPIRRAEQDGSAAADAYPQSYPDFGAPAAHPYVSPHSAPGGGAYRENSTAYQENGSTYQESGSNGGNGTYGETGTHGNGNETAFGKNGDSVGGSDHGDEVGSGIEDFKGLPRRVRQANLAPQLRASAAASPQAPTAVPQATAASLTDMRNTLSAMQRGWQEGRSQTQRDTED
jgi:signal transduction histidine kinase